MKLYIQYNFCGYRWYIVDDIYQQSETESIALDEFSYGAKISSTLRKLMLYDKYSLAYMNFDNRYVLALRHIREKERKDENGRSLLMTYIFEGDDHERELMDKMACIYINYKEILDKMLTSMILPVVDHVEFKHSELVTFIDQIKKLRYYKKIKFGRGKVLFLLSNWLDDTISSSLGLNKNDFKQVKHKLEEYNGVKLIEHPNGEEQEGEEQEGEKKFYYKTLLDKLKNCLCKIIRNIKSYYET